MDEMLEARKQLEAILPSIEEDNAQDITKAAAKMMTSLLEKSKDKKEEESSQGWDVFYSNLSASDKLQWRQITVCLMRSISLERTF
jgi:hypothetical protein